ncbi:hypothetical protein DSO57_1008879 [Entomophthora muscae]|uniref:Uncharacterized protein n=1 Tax=Entomophthora muscae TaxID=34485 RepID=A0ACC2RY07_9FUNG|nr:hypothetical protein DSO57_1008879 [Entomophthora muscae]
MGLANQVMPHTGSWHPLATAVNYLVQIAPIVYMAFQARPASTAGAQPDSGMGCDRYQVGDLESCECRHNGVDRHHPSEDLGVYVKSSKITGKIHKHVVYTGVYSYILGGAGQHQCGPGVLLGGV